MSEPRRKIPSVDALLRSEPGKRAEALVGRPLLKSSLTTVLEDVREAAAEGTLPPADDAILGRAVAMAHNVTSGLTPVLNATGVVLHTGLGRAPLPEEAARAAARAAHGYADLEVDRETGTRGRRTARTERALVALTGAEAALVVNNNAAALMLALGALARRKEVIVSRGELIEIGGEFRLPDIMAASGAKLVEVGTTNRTRLADYKAAITPRTALILKVHPSNFRVVGFQQAPSTQELAKVCAKAGVPLLYDIGSGLLEPSPSATGDEPALSDALAQGADLVCFSGDKLLGGPQAGVVLGRAELVERLRRDPVARAVRVDKMQVAALEAVLSMYARGRQSELPTWRMLREPPDKIKERAKAFARSLHGELEGAHVQACESTVGGGSVPGAVLPSWGVRLETSTPEDFAAHLRTGSPAVFCRVEDGAIFFDMRTVAPEELGTLARVVSYAMEADESRDTDD